MVNNGHEKAIERTLNTMRILASSDLQAGIVSLSLLVWKNLENAFRLPCLMTFVWIPATALNSGRMCRQRGTQNEHYWCDPRRQLVDCRNHRVVKIVQALPLQSPVEGGTNISAGQPKLSVVHIIDHRVLGPFHPATAQHRQGENSL